ncbi:hypothetical protein [Streptomyces mirabilis]|uniref:hypothetical protein n=1 Tax=Streptomyces mirabilis TaxID=68239 RepID=UPI0036AD63A2
MTTAMPHHTDLPAFATALAEHSPDSWITAHRVHPDDPYAFPLYGRVWDAGEVDNVAGDFHLDHDALLTASDGLRPCVIERPRLPRQFLVAPFDPEGCKPHHFRNVYEPGGIAVLESPARAATSIARRVATGPLRLPGR